MLKAIASITAIFLLAGCITSKPVNLPDGTQGHHIACGGAIYSAGDCMTKAGEVCGHNGYEILAAGTEATPYATASGSWHNASGGFGATSSSIVQREMFIRCKSQN